MVDAQVIVVGAGPVGLTVTLFLARAGVSVILVEALTDIDDSPRAMAYGAPAVLELERLGVADDARAIGMEPSDYDFRIRWITLDNRPIASFSNTDDPNSPKPVICGQFQLARIVQRHIAPYPNVKILFSHKVVEINETGECATVTCETDTVNKVSLTADYVVGADGARSTVRKLMDVEFEGFTLDRWIVACNVHYPFRDYGFYRGQFIVHPEHFAMVGKIDPTGLYRVSYNEDGSLTREEAIARVHEKFSAIFPGPKPLSRDAYKLVMCSPYRVHQRCSTTFRKGRFLLAGDAAHACNPFGGMGLTGGLVDAGGISDCLIGVLKMGCGDQLLDKYAEIRKQKFYDVINPISFNNIKLLYESDPETCAYTVEPFKSMNEDPGFRQRMIKGAYAMQ